MVALGGANSLPTEPRPRRFWPALYLAAGLTVLILAGSAIVFAVRGDSTDTNRGIRFEAETDSGTAYSISWAIGFDEDDTDYLKEFKTHVGTPWSMTVPETADRTDERTTLLVVPDDDNKATCRIFVDGKLAYENTSIKVAACIVAGYVLAFKTKSQKKTMKVRVRAYDKLGNVKYTTTRTWTRA
ncbi:hypothetical protein ACFQFC_23865 [Amorphoplanes digitatis]|uniref:Uncharacterized protein n=1 Tax=Actinoplanes digitatis TaxID=1868 RepID=A0A7W7MUZ9_9ACTN|nr:hypothetical protein [Actinoplanes digitatis]MBB4767257.1 hypothetical protein [Actinoplanes digitatis]GID97611.1 hypothetical protein Adi01nite_70230 [Actinoplanes digitatis]